MPISVANAAAQSPRPAPRTSTRRAPTLRARQPTVAPAPSPIVKWVGGKTRLLSELKARAPKQFRRYYEPFAGGAALFFHLAPRNAVLNDFNSDLVASYRCVAKNPEAVIRRLRGHRQRHDESYYYQMRDRWNALSDDRETPDRTALFIYLNKTCYNGLWRVNSKGGFNVPVGRYTNPPICDAPLLRAASSVLSRAKLRSGHFATAVADADKNDFVYFDPPYDPVSRTANFTSYTASSFGDDQQKQLAECARELADRGAHVMLSNSDTPFVRKLYKGFRIDQVMCSRAINSRANGRGQVAEVVIRNK